MKRKDDTTDSDGRDYLAGQMLIAMPGMGDPRFERSVVFICAHDRNHAMGIIINKPLADVKLSELVSQLDITPGEGAEDIPVFFGGPVQTGRGIVLHTLDYTLPATMRLAQGLGLTSTREVLIDIGGDVPLRDPPGRYLLAIGHASWKAGQLEKEIAMNSWAHCKADSSLIFDTGSDAVWQGALSTLGVTAAMFSPEWACDGDKSRLPH